MDIVPAIDAPTKEEFLDTLNKIKNFAKRVHVDFHDGTFQEFKTVLPQELERLPEDIAFEAHLMMARPMDYVAKLKELGFKKFIIQWEIEENIRDIIEELLNDEVLVGVAIGPETPVLDIEPVLELLDTVVIMTVVPGKQGQEFLADNLKKIQELHEGNFFGEVAVDGGVNEEDIKNVMSYRPETLIVGSYIVASPNPADSYETLMELAG